MVHHGKQVKKTKQKQKKKKKLKKHNKTKQMGETGSHCYTAPSHFEYCVHCVTSIQSEK